MDKISLQNIVVCYADGGNFSKNSNKNINKLVCATLTSALPFIIQLFLEEFFEFRFGNIKGHEITNALILTLHTKLLQK